MVRYTIEYGQTEEGGGSTERGTRLILSSVESCRVDVTKCTPSASLDMIPLPSLCPSLPPRCQTRSIAVAIIKNQPTLR